MEEKDKQVIKEAEARLRKALAYFKNGKLNNESLTEKIERVIASDPIDLGFAFLAAYQAVKLFINESPLFKTGTYVAFLLVALLGIIEPDKE